MNSTNLRHRCVLAIAPSSRGFGFAVVEVSGALIDWGVREVGGDKNAQSLVKLEQLLDLYRPQAMTLEDPLAEHCRRSPRIQKLCRRIIEIGGRRKIRMAIFSRKQVRRVFFANGEGTKYAIAEILAERFPEELGPRLPRKRRPWMNQDYRMDIFDAVALGLLPVLRRERKSQ